MIYTRTPFRISFLGGGTDYQSFFEQYGGCVISTTFDKYCYIGVRHLPRFFQYHNQVIYSKIERVVSVEEIEHPLVRNTMKLMEMQDLSISCDADLPARSGLGSSSSLTVGLLHAFHALKGEYTSNRRLAEEAIHVERELCAESGGWQDQVTVAYGGMNRISFSPDGFDVQPLVMENRRKKRLNRHLMMFFTGISRISSEIAREQMSATKDKTVDLLEILRLTDTCESILTDQSADLDEFGRLLDCAWQIKRTLTSKISTGVLDEIYGLAKKAGALGGKLLGAGGGGCFLFYVPLERQADVKTALRGLVQIPFRFEDEGSRVMYYSPDNDMTRRRAASGLPVRA